MAKQKAGVYDKVLECAKEEFLSKGFLDASLRTIAQAAETSTGSIYTRFGDKEGLFRAIAEPVVDQFKAMFRRVQEDFHQLSEEEQRADMGQYTARPGYGWGMSGPCRRESRCRQEPASPATGGGGST